MSLRKVLPGKFRQVCRSICSVFGKLGTLYYGFSIPGAIGDVPCFFGAGVVSMEAELRHRRHESTPSSHVALFLCRVKSQAQLSLEVTRGVENCRSRPLTMVMIKSNEDTFRFGSLYVPHFIELFRPFSR